MALKYLIKDAVLSANDSLYYLNGYSNAYVVTGIHPTAAKMNGNKRETSNAILYGLNVALAVSKTLKAGHHISSYTTHLNELDLQHQQLMSSNVNWIDSIWGVSSAVQAKTKITRYVLGDKTNQSLPRNQGLNSQTSNVSSLQYKMPYTSSKSLQLNQRMPSAEID